MSYAPSEDFTGEEDAEKSNRKKVESFADTVYARRLARNVTDIWKDKVDTIKELEQQADAVYEGDLARKALIHLKNLCRQRRAEVADLERRERAFKEWRNHRLIIRCLQRWIVRHRLNSMRRYQEHRMAENVVEAWLRKARYLKEKKDEFRKFYVRLKFFKLWKQVIALRKKRATEAELTRRYYQFKEVKSQRLAQGIFAKMREKMAQTREMELIADDFAEGRRDRRAAAMAHDAIRKFYEQTADNKENEAIADEFCEQHLITRLGILNANGKWRSQTRHIREMEARADEYREIRTQEVARDALRTVRNQTARNRQMEQQADGFHERQGKRVAAKALGTWRQAAAARRGDSVAREAPATPAARRSALFEGAREQT